MNAAMINRIVSLIPERVARAPSGVAFTPETSVSRHPERIAHLAEFLSWLSPLYPITKYDQRVFGLLNEQGRPVHAIDMEEDEAEGIEEAPAIEDARRTGEVREAEEALA